MWYVNDDGQRKITIVHLSIRLRCTKTGKSIKKKPQKYKKNKQTENNNNSPNPQETIQILSRPFFFYLIKLKEKHW